MSNASSQQGLSNEPCCYLGGVLVVPLRGILRVFTLSSSFRLRLAQYSTSEATNHIFEIPSTFRFDWIPSVSLGGLVVSEHPMSSYSPTLTSRLVPSSPVLRSARYLRHMKALNDVLLTPELNYSCIRKQSTNSLKFDS